MGGIGGGWEYFEMFLEGMNLYCYIFRKVYWIIWYFIIYVIWGIRNGFVKWEDMKYIWEKNDMCDVVCDIVFINFQKFLLKGVIRISFDDLYVFMEKYGYFLKWQIDLLDFNVLIFGNIFYFYRLLLGFMKFKLKLFNSINYLIYEFKLYIDVYYLVQIQVW